MKREERREKKRATGLAMSFSLSVLLDGVEKQKGGNIRPSAGRKEQK